VKPHYHHDFVGAFILSLEIALIWHGIRFLAGRAAGSSNSTVATVGTATGGAFTFGGNAS
jgi:hypothetical protein